MCHRLRKLLIVLAFGPPLLSGCESKKVENPNNSKKTTMTSERHEFDEQAELFIGDIMSEIYSRPRALTEREEVVYHVSWMMTEVNNGGFHQFFHNATGDDAPETANLLRRIGAPETASLLERGCELFPNGKPPKDYQERRLQLEKLAPAQLKALDELTERFYSREEDLHFLLKRYWDSAPPKSPSAPSSH